MTSKSIRSQLDQYRAYERQDLPYQSMDGFTEGIRKTKTRAKLMKLPEDFKGSSVLDLGCNTGAFCLEARRRKAGRVVGVEYSFRPLLIANEISQSKNLNISYCQANLNHGLISLAQRIGPYKFDYIFALSIWKHVYDQIFWSLIRGLTKKICWLELNAVSDGRHYGEELKGFLKKHQNSVKKMTKLLLAKSGALKVVFLGDTDDEGRRGCYMLIYDQGTIDKLDEPKN